MKAISRALGLSALSALIALAALALPAAVQAATPAPALKLSLTAQPTNFAPGTAGTIPAAPSTSLIVTNVGGAPTSGEITIKSTLPPGLTPLTPKAQSNGYKAPEPQCTPFASQTLTCTTEEPVQPGYSLWVHMPVEVNLPEGSALSAQAEVSGGNVAPLSAQLATTVTATPAPFDFLPHDDGFDSPLSEADGTPALSAGAHPFQLTTDLGFPTIRPGAASLTGTEHPRDVDVELPRGMHRQPLRRPHPLHRGPARLPELPRQGLPRLLDYRHGQPDPHHL